MTLCRGSEAHGGATCGGTVQPVVWLHNEGWFGGAKPSNCTCYWSGRG